MRIESVDCLIIVIFGMIYILNRKKGQIKWASITKGMFAIIEFLKPNLLKTLLELRDTSTSNPNNEPFFSNSSDYK